MYVIREVNTSLQGRFFIKEYRITYNDIVLMWIFAQVLK